MSGPSSFLFFFVLSIFLTHQFRLFSLDVSHKKFIGISMELRILGFCILIPILGVNPPLDFAKSPIS